VIRAAALVALAAALAGACASGARRQHQLASGVLVGGGVALIANAVHNANACDGMAETPGPVFGARCENAGGASALLGAAFLVGAIVAYFTAPEADDPVDAPPPPLAPRGPAVPPLDLPPPPTGDATLRQLTLQAEVAARRGDCTLVGVVADQVAARDPEYRRAGFLDDPRISTCLAHDAPPR
jgi:hypothetical protein